MEQQKVTLILPSFDNDGNNQLHVVESIIEEIAVLTGGVTATQVAGIWYENGKKYADTSTQITAVTDVATALVLETHAQDYCARLKQHALYFDVQLITVTFVPPLVHAA